MDLIYSGESRFVIPVNINEIKNDQFYFSDLKEITVPGNVKKIGDRAFSFSISLKKAVIEEGVLEIGESAFENCDSLTEIVIPSSVKKIGANAFLSCEKLKKVTLPEGLEKLEKGIFSDCEGLEKIVIPDSVKEFGEECFFGCESLKTVNIPEGVKTVPSGVFGNCKSLKNIKLPESIVTVNEDAFGGCFSVETFFIPKNFKNLTYEGSFGDVLDFCPNLKEIDIDPENPSLSSLDGVVYNKEKTALLYYPSGKTGDFEIPETVTKIGDYAFYQAKYLENIRISAKIKEIGENAFFGCSALKNIETDPKNTKYASCEGVLFNKDMSLLIAYPEKKEDCEYSVPDSVAEFATEFRGSQNLVKLHLGKNLEKVSGHFVCCSSLEEFDVDPENEFFSAYEGILMNKDGSELLQYPQGKKDTCFALPEKIVKMSHLSFYNCTNLKEFRLSKTALIKGLKVWAAIKN